jgi:hypothetical protein
MANYGMMPSIIDGTETIFNEPKNMGLPKEFSYKKYLPGVLNQGSDPICVPCSLSAYLNWDINVKDGSEKDNKIKVFDIFNNRGHDGEGMTFKEGLEILQNDGVKTSKGNVKINRYAKVNSPLALKYALMMNGPCVGGLPVYNSSITDFWLKDSGDFEGLHAVCIVGYNEDGFIIRNSWGNSYGSDGYAFITNENVNKFTEIWTIID